MDQPVNLLALYEDDLVGEEILSYASGSDLCTLDAVSKRFQRLTAGEPWRNATDKRFGMKNGKADWIKGTALLSRDPIYMHMVDDQDHGYGESFMGKATVATNGSLLAVVADDLEEGGFGRTYPVEQNGIGIRDAFSLSYSRTLPSPIINFNVAICGRAGSEIIVTVDNFQVAARRGNDVQGCAYTQQEVGNGGNPEGLLLLGSETHLIVAGGNTLKLYEVSKSIVTGEGSPVELVSLCYSATIGSPNDIANGNIIRNIAWGINHLQFITCHQHQIDVWEVDPGANRIIPTTETITESHDVLSNVSMSYEYIVGATDARTINVWNRFTGEKMYSLCDVDDEEDRIDEANYPISMSSHGNILVTTSHLGSILCIWDMRTGDLVKRYAHTEDEGPVDLLPDGFDACSMVYLEPLNAFVCMSTGAMMCWSFPMNKKQSDMASSIRRRELRLGRALYADDGSDEDGYYPLGF